ncbi:hypothetical protein CLOLEP_01800 [[Clostridium] leptum DSM 753]|uniref:Uncharacterized protein n=1 Tax=[Clostridium] leptum DSM 753 TaxID=428125 RepID=A7VTA9_9FIRM|nr:hypothetical protein CLOLEP_01800 [[Clostridium] leptum DSM 753]
MISIFSHDFIPTIFNRYNIVNISFVQSDFVIITVIFYFHFFDQPFTNISFAPTFSS